MGNGTGCSLGQSFGIAALAFGVSLHAGCASLAPLPDPVVDEREVHSVRVEVNLPNGMRVVGLPDPAAELVHVELALAVGARDDPPGKEGLAHLVEHLVFLERTNIDPERRGERLDAAISRLSIGHNASTSYDLTDYYELGAPEALEPLLRVARAQLLASCNVDNESFERERAVVESERRLRDDTPNGRQLAQLSLLAYPAGHPYAAHIGGTEKSLASAPRTPRRAPSPAPPSTRSPPTS